VKAEKAVEIDRSIRLLVVSCSRARNCDSWPQPIISRFAMRNHNIQPVSGSALEDRDQDFLTRRGRLCGIEGSL